MFNFDELLDFNTERSIKWSGGVNLLTDEQRSNNLLPMWVADMDFKVPQPILDAIHSEVNYGILGYPRIPDSYYEALLRWQYKKFGWSAKKEWVVTTPGVVSALDAAIRAFSHPGDYIIVQSPVYIHFHHDVIINGRRVIQSPLTFDSESGYHYDPVIFEKSILPNTKVFILCNPHNPTGNVWSREELRSMAEICHKHGIIIVADEAHQDFVFGEKKHISFGTLDEVYVNNAIICTAPGKTFNIAGLKCANTFIPNDRIRNSFKSELEKCGITSINSLGIVACEAGYRYCEDWVDAMLNYVKQNHLHLATKVRELNLPFKVIPTNSLYLAWLDFRELGLNNKELSNLLLTKVGLWLDEGIKFGNGGDGFMRINLACPRARVDEALKRLDVFFNPK